MVAIVVITDVVCAVPVGRILDRVGIARGLRLLLVARGVEYVVLLLAVVRHLPVVVLLVLAAIVGGLLGAFRALLNLVVGRAEGFALINTAQGLGFGLGALSLSMRRPTRSVEPRAQELPAVDLWPPGSTYW